MSKKLFKTVCLVSFLILIVCAFSACHDHAFGEWQQEKPATCAEVGSVIRTCECGAEERNELPRSSHTFGEWVITALSNCSVEGTAQRVCRDCGATEEKALMTDPARHVYGEWSVTTAATCIADGEATRTCVCGAFETKVVTGGEHLLVIAAEKAPTTEECGWTEGSYCYYCKKIFALQQEVDKLPPAGANILQELRYQGDTTGALIFYWDVAEAYAPALEKIRVTVSNGAQTSTYEIAADAASWAYQVVGDQATYRFTFEPVANVGETVNTVSSTFCWMPQLTELSFPRLEITTEEGELPTFDKVMAPEGYWGAGITNADYVQSILNLYNGDNELLYSSEAKGFDGAKIKVRGNTSAYQNKSPYKIKLDKKADLLAGLVEREDGVDYRDKNWVLLASGWSYNVAIGYTVSELVGMDWTPAYSYVSLFINGEYRGIYILIEGVEQSESRCDVSDEGYIVELDAYWWNEDLFFTTPSSENTNSKYTFKYPDAEDIDETSEEYRYIKQFLTDFENALANGEDISQYIDLQSFAKWLLVHDIVGTYDSGGSNIYLTKYDSTDGSVLKMTLVWDFDSICWDGDLSNAECLARIRSSSIFYMPQLLQNEQFLEAYAAEYAAIRDLLLGTLADEMALLDNETYRALRVAEDLRWGTHYVSTAPTAEQYLAWFAAHLDWMDEAA